VASQRHAVGSGMRSQSRTCLSGLKKLGVTIVAISTFLSGLAVLAVSIEMPVTAAVFGALAFYAVGHVA
jgi:hypothetical protein